MDIEKKKPSATKSERSWEHIESDLKDALNTWSDLTAELSDKVSPEEAQLQEIKALLGTLKDKLKEFSEDASEARTESRAESRTESRTEARVDSPAGSRDKTPRKN